MQRICFLFDLTESQTSGMSDLFEKGGSCVLSHATQTRDLASAHYHHPTKAMADYAAALARISVAQIVRGAYDELHGGQGFTLIQRSACDSLVDVISRYVRTVGSVSAQAAQHASRSEANMNDVLLGLSAAGGASLEDLLDFAKSAPDLQFPRDVARFPCAAGPEEGRGSANSSVKDASRKPARAAEPRPQYVPDFLPPFPDPCTYRRTATHNKRAMDPLQARKQRAKLKRQAQESLLGLQQGDGASCSADGFCGAAASTAAPPPAPLPSLRPAAASTAEAMGDGVSDGGGGAAGSRLVPDVLVPGVAAVLQSSAASECGGLQAASAVPARAHSGATRGAAGTAGATGSSAKRTKQERPVCSGACVASRRARAAPCPPLTRASLPPRTGGHPRPAAPA